MGREREKLGRESGTREWDKRERIEAREREEWGERKGEVSGAKE